MDKTKVHVIPHSHWDREWYFTTSRSTVYLVNHIKEVLETLEKNKKFKYFLMDAQSSLIEDYVKYCPEDVERLKKLIKEKRFFVGPWYTQTDQLVISQESVVRNMLYGSRIAKEYGHSMEIGYVPDAFGQGANMPQIYKQFGIDRFLFWRGVADNKLKKDEFIWIGSDGTEMLAEQIPFGYYYGGNIPENEKDLKEYLEKQISKLEEKSETGLIYFPNGFDQAPIRKNLPDLMEKFNEMDSKREYKISNPELFFDELEKSIKNKDNLTKLIGELTEAKHSRIHKTIFSTRMDLKQENNKIENFIANVLEPVLSISYSLGNRYPHKEIEEIWKLMFKNAAHDSIGGCNSDTTNKDIKFRYKLARDLSENLLELHMRLISEKIENKEEYNFTVFNPLPYNKNEVVKVKAYISDDKFRIYNDNGEDLEYEVLSRIDQTDYVLNQCILLNPSKKIYKPEKVYLAELLVNIKDVPSLGYSRFYLKPLDEKQDFDVEKTAEKVIENEKYKITLENNNTLTILNKINGKEYKNQMIFEENGDDGDSYNYSPPRKDMVISSTEATLLYIQTIKSNVHNELNLEFELKVPGNLEERAKGLKEKILKYTVKIELRKNEEIIRFNVKFRNEVYSHRVCVVFDTEVASEMSTADQLFGIIQRPVKLKELEVWEKEKWQEKPISIEPMQSFATLFDKNKGSAVITENIREYEIIGENFEKIRLTLFRTFGYMGKENLVYRPGRASGETIVKTPDAQLIGDLECDFALYLYESDFDNAKVAKIAKEYLTPFPVYQFSDFLNGRLIFSHRDEEKTLPQKYSLYNFSDTEAVMSTFKKAEDSENYIIRYFNPYLNKEVILDERVGKDTVKLTEIEKDEFKNTLKYCEFATYKI